MKDNRIKELAEQAGLLGPSSRVGHAHEATEKFAELIIAECAKLCEPAAQPEQEPVAWGVKKRGGMVWYVNDSRSVCQGYANHYQHRDANGSDQDAIPLYTSPPKRQPLTEFQRMQIIGQEFPLPLVEPIVIQKIDAVCVAIEAAHDIKEKNT